MAEEAQQHGSTLGAVSVREHALAAGTLRLPALRWIVMAILTCGMPDVVGAEALTRTRLWDEKPTPSDQTGPDEAYLTVHRPQRPNGACVVICPGGGYGGVVVEPEGHGIARWFNEHGVTGVVLEYRLPHGRPAVPLADAQRAIRWTRAHAADWQCDPQRIGLIGFSAGGHLAATAATHFDRGDAGSPDVILRSSCRPDFVVLIYPVITMGPGGHEGSRANLLGDQPTPELVAEYSNELHVSADTPPTFLAHAQDDRVVIPENSRRMYRSLRERGVTTRYLELPRGGHGLFGYRGATWDAWQQGALNWLAEINMIPQADARTTMTTNRHWSSVTYEQLANGSQRVRLLPGTDAFVFSLYGVPGDPLAVESLVTELRDQGLANGFDPGPAVTEQNRALFEFLAANGWPVVLYSGAEMQVAGGRAQFSASHESILEPFHRMGLFTAYQLGEWGYYFHNLSHRESWWRDVYGAEYEAFAHLKKPAGLAGYDRRPSSKRECYDAVKDYFVRRQRALLNRVISVTGHSHYESYAAEWGAACIGLELGENIAFTQSKLAFARGASRQWNRPWSVQVSPWFGPSVTSRGPLRKEGTITQGLDAGHSLSFYERMWLHSWFAGAAMVTPENSVNSFFETSTAPWSLTAHGQKAAETFRFMRQHDRGLPYTPIAIVLDHFAGYNGYMDRPWGILEPTAGDRQLRDLFDHQWFPGSDHIHEPADAKNPEASYLRATPYGEIADVLLSNVTADVLTGYPIILLAGDIDFDEPLLGNLEVALRRRCRVLLSTQHVAQLGEQFARLQQQGNVEVLEAWVNPSTNRAAAISDRRLQSLASEFLPVKVSGDAVQFAINRTQRGWVVELVNNRGVQKRGDAPSVVDAQAVARVNIEAHFPVASAQVWRQSPFQQADGRVDVELGPGAVEYVEFTEAP